MICIKKNVKVHNVAKQDGGLQQIEVDNEVVDFEFTKTEKFLTFKIHKPAPHQLADTTHTSRFG
jgi:hypothetical protein